jgi:hypothetical protein
MSSISGKFSCASFGHRATLHEPARARRLRWRQHGQLADTDAPGPGAIREARDDYAIFSGLAERLGFGPDFTEGLSPSQWLELLLTAIHNKRLRERYQYSAGVRIGAPKREETMHSRKPTNKVIAATAIALLAAPSSTSAANLTPQEQKLVEGAKKEGAVTILNPIFSDRTGQHLAEAFTRRYDLGSDFKFNNLRKGTGQTVAQVRQEILANKFTVDILLVSARVL